MQFKIIKPFRWRGNVRMPGQTVEMELSEAGRLRSMGLIGNAGPERAVKPPPERAIEPRPERAVKEPPERRTRRTKNEADADNASGN